MTSTATHTGSSREVRMRTCIACGKKAPKADLLRIVHEHGAPVRFDAAGTGAGRGAYVCDDSCLTEAIRTGRLARALKMKLNQEALGSVVRDVAQVGAGSGDRDKE